MGGANAPIVAEKTSGIMNEQERNKRLIEEHYAAFWGGHETLIRRQIADDFIDHGTPGTPKGIEALLDFSRGARESFPDMKVTIQSVIAEGDRVAVHATWQGTHRGPFQSVPATNKVITFEGMVFWRIANSKIAERWAILDTAAIMRQLQG